VAFKSLIRVAGTHAGLRLHAVTFNDFWL